MIRLHIHGPDNHDVDTQQMPLTGPPPPHDGPAIPLLKRIKQGHQANLLWCIEAVSTIFCFFIIYQYGSSKVVFLLILIGAVFFSKIKNHVYINGKPYSMWITRCLTAVVLSCLISLVELNKTFGGTSIEGSAENSPERSPAVSLTWAEVLIKIIQDLGQYVNRKELIQTLIRCFLIVLVCLVLQFLITESECCLKELTSRETAKTTTWYRFGRLTLTMGFLSAQLTALMYHVHNLEEYITVDEVQFLFNLNFGAMKFVFVFFVIIEIKEFLISFWRVFCFVLRLVRNCWTTISRVTGSVVGSVIRLCKGTPEKAPDDIELQRGTAEEEEEEEQAAPVTAFEPNNILVAPVADLGVNDGELKGDIKELKVELKNLTVDLKGLTVDLKELTFDLKELVHDLNTKFNDLNTKFDDLNTKFDTKFDELKAVILEGLKHSTAG